ELEVTFLRCLCWAALPGLIVATVRAFFAGRGDTGSVMLFTAVGLIVNAVLAYAPTFGHGGFPALGFAGRGWAPVGGTTASARRWRCWSASASARTGRTWPSAPRGPDFNWAGC